MADIIPITNLTPAMSSAFGYQPSDLSEGAALGFPVLSYRGKVWRVMHKGTENKLMTPDNDPIPSVRVVILRANANLSKIFYEKRYTEGDNAAPDCYSMNGVAPDSGATKPQCKTCAACPQAAWGSRMTDEGKEAKACQDSRRLVVVPATDVANEAMGGPMLMRVPAASLGNLVAYDDRLKQAGIAYFGVSTKISFDSDVAYPKMVFDYDADGSAQLHANPATAQAILALRDGDAGKRILSTTTADEHGAAAPTPQPAKVVPPPVQEVVVEAPPVVTPVPVQETPPPVPVEAAATEAVTPQSDIDALVSGLLS
jgi:hypothetical protein